MLGALGHGATVALRVGLMPLIMGLRLAHRVLQDEPEGIPRRERSLRVLGKIALDEVFFSTELISGSMLSLREHGRVAREMDAALELYESRGWLREPADYHLDPPPLRDVRLDRFGSLWGPYQHLRFESGYEPHLGEPGRDRWLSYAPNQRAHAWLLEHPGPPRPWLVCIPGYRMGSPMVDFVGFRARWLHLTLGMNIAISVLPMHGPRRVGSRGGDGFLSGDFLDTVHAQTQAVWDVRRLIEWLRTNRSDAIGIYGVSLGAYTTALVASLERELACAIAGNPAADFLRLMCSHLPPVVVRLAARLGFPFETIESLLRVISPLVLKPRVPHARRFLYAGLADRLAPPDHARDLWQHWDRPRLEWYEGSHVSFLWERKVQELIEGALRTSELLPKEADARV